MDADHHHDNGRVWGPDPQNHDGSLLRRYHSHRWDFSDGTLHFTRQRSVDVATKGEKDFGLC